MTTRFFGLIIGILIASSQSFAIPPHMDLDMTGEEYARMLSHRSSFFSFSTPDDAQLKIIMEVGKRNLDWLKFINQHRDANHKISFSSAATQGATPIDKPNIYNPTIVRKGYDDLIAMVPASLKSVLTGTGSLPENPTLSDEDYIVWGRKVDKSYQSASRWLMLEPYLSYLRQRRQMDVRGYYFLNLETNLKDELTHWSTLSHDKAKQLTDDLVGICINNSSNSAEDCLAGLNTAISNDQVLDFYTSYIAEAKNTWDSFFVIQATRTDTTWMKMPETLHIPFVTPQSNEVKSFLADNIQDEWKWSDWHLLLDFGALSNNSPHVVFVPGATPHVNGLAGNEITMDADEPLTEYNVQWTIRHEFGHVLGFPDCYVEFYDDNQQAMVNYQLDITNLMCSRKGHLQEKHYSELKRVYGSR